MTTKLHYFIFESGRASLGPHNRLKDAENEAKEYGISNPVVRCFETDSREQAEIENVRFEKELACATQ